MNFLEVKALKILSIGGACVEQFNADLGRLDNELVAPLFPRTCKNP